MLVGLLLRRYEGEAWRIAQSERGIFVEELLLYAPVVFEHESIVGVSNEEHIEDALENQVHVVRVLEV